MQTLVHPGFKCGFDQGVTWNLMNNDVALLRLNYPSAGPTIDTIPFSREQLRWQWCCAAPLAPLGIPRSPAAVVAAPTPAAPPAPAPAMQPSKRGPTPCPPAPC